MQGRLRAGEFSALFREHLGWDRAASSFSVTLIEPGQRGLGRPDSSAAYLPPAALVSHTFTLQAVAQKCGMTVFVCSSLPDGSIPNAPTRYRLQHRATKIARENILVFHNTSNTRQIWQWVRRGADVPVHLCEHEFFLPRDIQTLTQRLMSIAIQLVEEETGRITLPEVVQRVSRAFYNRRERKVRAPYRRVGISDFGLEQGDEGLQSWLQYVYSIPRLGRREEYDLAWAVRRGDAVAQQRLLEANLYLVADLALKMMPDTQCDRSLLSDLMQEGYFGLHGSVENFDPRRGYRFQTYAPLRILRHMTRAMHDLAKPIHIPHHLLTKLNEIRPLYALETDRLWQLLTREPTITEIASRLGLTHKEKEDLFLLTDQVQSADAPELFSALRKIVDEDPTHCPVAALGMQAVSEEIMRQLNVLTGREKAVIIMRLGLTGDEPKTLEEAGLKLHVTRERARQLESSALIKLRRRGVQLRGADAAVPQTSA